MVGAGARRARGDSAGDDFPIVGIGASAGGLEAFTQLLGALPPDTGMAFVLIQHLDPTHTSLLSEALAKATAMPVRQAEDGSPVEPNHVYVIPPNADIAILHGRLTLLPRNDEAHKPHLPVDFFFRALAADRGNHAIGVVLSGTASDGTEGLRAIKAENGITFAQAPRSAKFGGMPHSAIEAGVVDYPLAIPAIAEELVRLSGHPYLAGDRLRPEANDDRTLNKIFVLVRNAFGLDFSEYKAPTFERRLARRMALRQVDGISAYLAILIAEPEELRRLYEDALIHVTSFFRDPEVFDALKTSVFPEILKHKAEGAPVRLWVAGCSTGEEVYSLAISLLEFIGDSYPSHAIQIFGSDVSEKAIEKARLGNYPDSALRDVTDERRKRFFSKADGGYRINKNVRDLCVFVKHDLARDPPFSKLDLVSCRNVLIYFDQVLQKRVVRTFHYALNQPGYLLLGRTENISGFSHVFSATDKSSKVFARTAVASTLEFAPRSEVHPLVQHRAHEGFPEGSRRAVDLGKHLDRMLAARYAPPGVLINSKLEILQFRGETGAYLRAAPGEPQNNLLKMARVGLLSELRATIARAKQGLLPARAEAVEVEYDGLHRTCDISVVPFTGPADTGDHLFVVVFEEAGRAADDRVRWPDSRRPPQRSQSARVSKLEHELTATKEYLQSLIEDHGKTNDELNSANEELVSGNEELQSMNEELETAKEELQATNEELTTVNDELHSRNREVSEINGDLVNLLSTVDVPILILDSKHRIRRFTPKARSILNVVPSDVGRPLDDIRINVDAPDLSQRISGVIETNVMYESEVRDRDGRWYRMQIRPYKTTDNRIDGATLSLVDIDVLKQHVREAQEARSEAERANRAKDQFLATLSHELRSPLSTMLLHAQMLRRSDMDPKVKRAGEAIERGTKMQAQLIDDLLDISRIVAGKLKLELQPVDLRAVVNTAFEGVAGLAQKKSTRLEVTLDELPIQVPGDPMRLQQVVLNLLTNAIKFTPEGGLVNVRLEVVAGRVRLSVTDTGIGIEPEFLPHVFNRFTQADALSAQSYGGLGLGLAIVRHLVEAHGGTVQAESAGKDKGSTFSVSLPLVALPKSERDGEGDSVLRRASRADRGGGDYSKVKGLRILVVDDDLETREAVAEILGQIGADVRVAESASQAETVMRDFRPELLLCDIAMPGEDGYSFVRRIRARGPARGGDIPALALTALAGEENRRLALSAGFQLHLPKPIDMDCLTRAVADLSGRAVPALQDVQTT